MDALPDRMDAREMRKSFSPLDTMYPTTPMLSRALDRRKDANVEGKTMYPARSSQEKSLASKDHHQPMFLSLSKTIWSYLEIVSCVACFLGLLSAAMKVSISCVSYHAVRMSQKNKAAGLKLQI